MKVNYNLVLVSILLSFIMIGNASADLNDGLVAYYPFNGNANDESGNTNDGIVYGATLTKDRFGNSNSAYSFNGIDNYINVANSKLLNPQEITITAWVNPIDLSDDGIIVNKEDQYEVAIFGRAVHDTKTNEVAFAFNPKWYWYGSNYTVVLNEFIHVAIVFNSSYEAKTYINGSLKRQVQYSSPISTTSNCLRIGARGCISGASPYEFFNGIIDDVRIYNRALSRPEIQQLYQGVTQCDSPSNVEKSNTKILLGENDTFTLFDNAEVFGTKGNETLRIAGIPNATIDSNIERLEFPNNIIEYQFSLTGNILKISNTKGVIANVIASENPLKLAFEDGSVDFNLTALDNGIFSNGSLDLLRHNNIIKSIT